MPITTKTQQDILLAARRLEQTKNAQRIDNADVTTHGFTTTVELWVHRPTSRTGKVEYILELTPDQAETLALALIHHAVRARDNVS